MEWVAAVVGLAASGAKLLQVLVSMLGARTRAVPPEPNDGVAVARFVTPAVEQPTADELRSLKRRARGYLALITMGFLLGVVATGDNPRLFALLVGEAVLLAGFPIMTLRRNRRPDEPANRVQRVAVVCGPIDAVAARLRRAFREMRALSLAGTSIVAGGDHFAIQGGNGLWGTERDRGYCVRATVRPAEGGWEVTVESSNFAPSLIQSLRNHRNVARVLRQLLA